MVFSCFSSSDESFEPLAHLRIPFSEIKKATNNFDESRKIGKGGFGAVYEGTISNGADAVTRAAIKRLSQYSKVGEAQFLSELRLLSGCHHPNLVTLIGFCCEDTKKETIIVYEYASKGSLDRYLHDLRTPLSWHDRLKICLGAARGLDYLHTGAGIIHRDVKTANILLDKNWEAKISDFGLSKIGPTDQPSAPRLLTFSKGSFGYLDPYSLSSGRILTKESDVYSFGVVLLEILCRKRAVFDGQRSLVTWVQDSVKGNRMEKSPEFFKDIFGFSNLNSEDVIDPDLRNFLDIIDNDLMYEINPKSLKYFVGAAERCLHEIPKQRPNMSEVVRCLESALASQERINNELQSTENVKEFLFSDLEKATRGFSRDLRIGEGGFGSVYRGWLDGKVSASLEKGVGTAVAVQWITSDIIQLHNEWLEEVNFFGQLAHPNIISLLGFCNKNEHERLFVYEYMKTSLSHFIHGDYHLEPLSWGTRLKVMIGVARGLAHLYTTKGILCHFQCSDILLDEDFNAKIGGFGWSKIRERHGNMRQEGAFGYLKADYDISTGHLLMKSDICSFGLVLLETLTGRHLGNLDDVLEGLESLEIRAPKSRSNRRKLKKMMDPRLKGSYSIDGAFKCMALTLRCIAIQPEYRPSREEIVWSLEQIYALNK